MFTDFILVRHGETDYNRLRILQGWIDSSLNENGYRQAEVTAEILRNESFDEVWHSDLQRAEKTAETILKYHPGIPCFPYIPLREWKLGFIQNMSHEQLEKDYPEYEAMLKNEESDLKIPDAERRSEFQARINNAFLALAERSPGKRLLIVTHGGVLVRLYRFLGGEIPEHGKVPIPGNASVSRIRYDHETNQWSILAWNQVYSSQANEKSGHPAL